MNYLVVALAGGIGAAARYGIARCMEPWSASFPWHIFAVNVVGCLAFGVAWAIGTNRWPDVVLTGVLAGLLGGFTTFSSFAYDSVALIQSGRHLAAAANLVGQNVLGVAAVLAGITIGRAV